jgi:AAA family ATP:ADP antiporter
MLGASLGAIVGGDVAARLMKPLGSYKLMLLSAALLVVCIGITRVIHARAAIVQRVAEIPLKDTGVLELLFKDRYLLMIALLMVLLNLVNSTGEFLLDRFVTAKAILEAGDNLLKRQEIIGQFKGVYFSYANGVSMLLQLFLVSRIFRYAGVGAALLILPAIALTGYSMILAVPVLGIIRWVKIFENGTDYSIQNTVRQALFLPTSREAKYKAKAAIDSFFVRTGDVFSAGLVYVGLNWFALDITGFATVNLVLTLVWIGMAIAIAREYMRRTHIPAPVVSHPESTAPESANQGAVA